MNLPFYIARRYLFSPKKHNAINVISGISVCGVSLAAMAMVCILSGFNGFQDVAAMFFSAFDPQLKITPAGGKTFSCEDPRIKAVAHMPEVSVFTRTLEEQAMVEYKDRHAMAVIKGVDPNFNHLTNIESILYGGGNFLVSDNDVSYAVMGIELVGTLGTGLRFVDPLTVHAPRREGRINMSNPASAFRKGYLFSPGCAFIVSQPKYDSRYILTSMHFVRDLYDYDPDAVSSIELKLTDDTSIDAFKARLSQHLGTDFVVQNRYEQQHDSLSIMEVEKYISYLMLILILVIASFNVIGSLSMLMLDKRENVSTLRSLGASNRLIVHIFLFEGWMISLCGALSGILIGTILCLLQQHFGLISLGHSGSFLVDAYPVSLRMGDIVLVFITVLVVGFASVWYPVKYLSKRLL